MDLRTARSRMGLTEKMNDRRESRVRCGRNASKMTHAKMAGSIDHRMHRVLNHAVTPRTYRLCRGLVDVSH